MSAYIPKEKMLAAVRALGLDPNECASVHMTNREVVVEVRPQRAKAGPWESIRHTYIVGGPAEVE